MASESSLFDDYSAYHRDRRNLICHEIGIPLIVLGIIALLRLLPLPLVHDLAAVSVVAVSLYYISLGSTVRAAAAVAIGGMTLLYIAAAYLSWPLAIAAFVVGWVFQ